MWLACALHGWRVVTAAPPRAGAHGVGGPWGLGGLGSPARRTHQSLARCSVGAVHLGRCRHATPNALLLAPGVRPGCGTGVDSGRWVRHGDIPRGTVAHAALRGHPTPVPVRLCAGSPAQSTGGREQWRAGGGPNLSTVHVLRAAGGLHDRPCPPCLFLVHVRYAPLPPRGPCAWCT